MSSSKAFQDLLGIYFGSGKWLNSSNKWYVRLWLFVKGKEYRARRTKLLDTRSLRNSHRRIKADMLSGNYLLSKIPKGYSAFGARLPIPDNYTFGDKNVQE